jgi:hypothetical protein
MKSKFESPTAFCPFYRHEYYKSAKIFCEGIDEVKTITLTFKTPKEMKIYREFYCDKKENYLKCKIADMLDYNKY